MGCYSDGGGGEGLEDSGAGAPMGLEGRGCAQVGLVGLVLRWSYFDGLGTSGAATPIELEVRGWEQVGMLFRWS